MNEGKFGIKEASSLVAISISVKVFFTSPSVLMEIAGTASWYLTIISALTALAGFTAVCALLNRYPDSNLVTAFEGALGRPVGFAVSLILSIYLMTESGVLLREFAEVLKVYTLPLTPVSFVIIAFILMVVSACLFGLEAIARVAAFYSGVLLIGFLILIVLSWNTYDFHNLHPILGNGLGTTIKSGIFRSSAYSEVIGLGIIAGSLQGIVHVRKAGYLALLIAGLIVSTSLLACLLAFNYSTGQEMVSQMYTLARVINLGSFFQRLDPIFIFTWCLGSLVGVSFTFYCSLSAYCKAFTIKDMRPLIVPASIVLFTISLVPASLSQITAYVHVYRQYGWILTFGFPLVALVVSMIRGEGEEKKDV